MSQSSAKPAWNPDKYISWGLLGAVIGFVALAFLYDDAPAVGFLVLAFSALILQIGIIAKGVEVGMKAAWPTDDETD